MALAGHRRLDVVGGLLERRQLALHLLFAPPGDPEERLVAGVLGHQHHHLSLGLPAGPALALYRADRGGDGLVKTDEVDLGNVEPLLGDAGGDEHLELAGFELLERLLLLGLAHPV